MIKNNFATWGCNEPLLGCNRRESRIHETCSRVGMRSSNSCETSASYSSNYETKVLGSSDGTNSASEGSNSVDSHFVCQNGHYCFYSECDECSAEVKYVQSTRDQLKRYISNRQSSQRSESFVSQDPDSLEEKEAMDARAADLIHRTRIANSNQIVIRKSRKTFTFATFNFWRLGKSSSGKVKRNIPKIAEVLFSKNFSKRPRSFSFMAIQELCAQNSNEIKEFLAQCKLYSDIEIIISPASTKRTNSKTGAVDFFAFIHDKDCIIQSKEFISDILIQNAHFSYVPYCVKFEFRSTNFGVISVHLTPDINASQKRREEITKILEYITPDLNSRIWIISGDCNFQDAQESTAVSRILVGWTHANSEGVKTNSVVTNSPKPYDDVFIHVPPLYRNKFESYSSNDYLEEMPENVQSVTGGYQFDAVHFDPNSKSSTFQYRSEFSDHAPCFYPIVFYHCKSEFVQSSFFEPNSGSQSVESSTRSIEEKKPAKLILDTPKNESTKVIKHDEVSKKSKLPVKKHEKETKASKKSHQKSSKEKLKESKPNKIEKKEKPSSVQTKSKK